MFVYSLYGREIVINSDAGDIKLEPSEIYEQVACETCGKVFNNPFQRNLF